VGEGGHAGGVSGGAVQATGPNPATMERTINLPALGHMHKLDLKVQRVYGSPMMAAANNMPTTWGPKWAVGARCPSSNNTMEQHTTTAAGACW
jgi:hypothetical protein